MVDFKDIKTGQFFTNGKSPVNTRLKTDYGYIDAHNETKKETKDLEWYLELMTDEQVLEQYKGSNIASIDSLRKKLLSK